MTATRPPVATAVRLPPTMTPMPIFAATTREPGDLRIDVFSNRRSRSQTFVRHEIASPRDTRPGDVAMTEREAEAVPGRHFLIAATRQLPDAAAFAESIAAGLTPEQRVVVFVHGYNNSYRQALYAVAQMRRDTGLALVPVLFSFASQGQVTGYGHDKDSALAARPALATLLERLAAATGSRVDVAAHSMGAWLAVEALNEIALNRGLTGRTRIGGLMLASPDIDADLFDGLWPRVREVVERAVVVCNPGDGALRLSTDIGGGRPRVGNLADCGRAVSARYAGLEAIDVSRFDATSQDAFRHNPGTNTGLIPVLAALAQRGR